MQTQGAASAVQTSRHRAGISGRRVASRANGAWRWFLLARTCAAGIVAGAAETASSFELVDTGITGSDKFDGGAVVGDGRVVFAPLSANGVGVFNPTNDSFTLVDISPPIHSRYKFMGAAVVGDGRVVFAPHNVLGVGVFDPRDDSFTLLDIGATNAINSGARFVGAGVMGDGRVVFAPSNADGLGVFDPTDDSFTLVNISTTISTGRKFAGAATVGDGRVVFAPGHADAVGVYSPPPPPNCTSCEAKLHGYGLIVDRIVKGECVEG